MDRTADLDGVTTVNYYKCESNRHSEFTCLSAYYHNRRFIRAKWCATCDNRYPKEFGNGNV